MDTSTIVALIAIAGAGLYFFVFRKEMNPIQNTSFNVASPAAPRKAPAMGGMISVGNNVFQTAATISPDYSSARSTIVTQGGNGRTATVGGGKTTADTTTDPYANDPSAPPVALVPAKLPPTTVNPLIDGTLRRLESFGRNVKGKGY